MSEEQIELIIRLILESTKEKKNLALIQSIRSKLRGEK